MYAGVLIFLRLEMFLYCSNSGLLNLWAHAFSQFFKYVYYHYIFWQVSASLTESGESPDHRNELIELVASMQSGMLQLFSQHQLQVCCLQSILSFHF